MAKDLKGAVDTLITKSGGGISYDIASLRARVSQLGGGTYNDLNNLYDFAMTYMPYSGGAGG